MAKPIRCIIIDDEAVARDILAMHLQQMDGIHIVAQCRNAMEALNAISQHVIDLAFLDINMPEVSGLAFAKSITKDIKVIFTTAYRDYAVEGFELQALDYVMKPITFERLQQAVNRYFELIATPNIETTETSDTQDFIFVRADRQMQKVDFEDILYIESYSDYIKIHCKDRTVVTRENISTMEAKLPTPQFLRIHRSYLVAIAHIMSFTHESVSLAGQTLTISRSYKSDVLQKLEGF